MAKLLVFGAGGFIGGRLVQAALMQGWRVTAAIHSGEAHLPGAEWVQCDVTAPGVVDALVQSTCPDAVANLVASANIDRAEIERKEAYQINTTAAVEMAAVAARLGCRFLHFSSDAVFDGSQERYTEEDPPNPLNYYGYTKAEADRQVLQTHPGAAILRISLALGFPLQKGNAFLSMLRDRLGQGNAVYTPEDEIRTPVDINTLCAAVLELAESSFAGLLNIGALDSIDRYTMTCKMAERLGYDTQLIHRAGPPHPGRAPRHKYGILSVEKARRILRTPLLNIDETLARAVETSGLSSRKERE